MSQLTPFPAPQRPFDHHIAGRAVPSEKGGFFESINPTTGAVWAKFALGTRDDVNAAVEAARASLSSDWGNMSATRRGRAMMAWGEEILRHAEEIARIESTQNGKLIGDSFGQAKGLVDWLYYYGGLADKIEGSVIPLERASILNYTLPEPLGVIGVITPWNSPASLTLAAVAPALAAGNAVVIKPSEVASASILRLAELAVSAGIPAGVVNVVTGEREAGEALASHPGVAKIAFTGSVAAGRAIARTAGERLVPVTLELGGKSPNIVFPDADLKRAEASILAGIYSSTGQTCVAGSRLYVHESIMDDLVGRLAERARGLLVGDPFDPSVQVGPVATKAQLQKDLSSVEEAVESGGTVIAGGRIVRPSGLENGFYFEPTILAGLSSENPVLKTEIFGPVLSVMPFRDEEEAVSMANDSPFGLAAGLWTLDARRVQRLARKLDAGNVWINMYRAFAFASPFSGFKQSGIGSQNGQTAIRHYLRTKSVWVESTDVVEDPLARS